jgi:hypothetical protein
MAPFRIPTEYGRGRAAPVAIDGSSLLEVGTVGDAMLGALTVDAGSTLSRSGNIGSNTGYNEGMMMATGGTLVMDASPCGLRGRRSSAFAHALGAGVQAVLF